MIARSVSPTRAVGEEALLPNASHTDNTRLEAFSDAIFGFAATLLVVSLDVPTSFDALVKSLKGFPAFGLSFVALVAIWRAHRDFFRRYPLGDERTIALNTALLFLVLFFVYPLKFLMRLLVIVLSFGRLGDGVVMMRQSDLVGMFVIYGLGWAAVFGCFAAMYFHASRRARVLDFGPNDVEFAEDRSGHYLVIASIGLLSTALALGNVGVSLGVPGWAYVANGPLLGLYWSWTRRRRGRINAGA